MAACDVLVNLRSPTMGETSGSVIRGLSLGKPIARLRPRLVRRAARRGRAEDPGRRVRGGDDRGGARAREPTTPRRARRRGARATSRPRARPRPRRRRLRRRARGGGRAARRSRDAVLAPIAEAAAEIGLDDPAELARAAREAGSRLSTVTAARARAVAIPASGLARRDRRLLDRRCASRSPTGSWRPGSWSTRSSTPSSRRTSPRSGQFLVRGVPSHGYGFVYPLLIAPAWRSSASVPDAYAAAKTINARPHVARRGPGLPARPPSPAAEARPARGASSRCSCPRCSTRAC